MDWGGEHGSHQWSLWRDLIIADHPADLFHQIVAVRDVLRCPPTRHVDEKPVPVSLIRPKAQRGQDPLNLPGRNRHTEFARHKGDRKLNRGNGSSQTLDID